MGSNYLIIVILLAVLSNCHSHLVYSEESEKAVRGVYKECLAEDTVERKSLCRGIFGPDCLNGSFCDHVSIVKESKAQFDFRNVNFENYDKRSFLNSPYKGIVYIIAFAPYVNIDGNSTAACKPEITLKDFKFFIYKFPGERRFSHSAGTQQLIWDEREPLTGSGFIKKGAWGTSCQTRLRERNQIINHYKKNGREIDDYSNAGMLINGEYIQFLIANFYDGYNEKEKLQIKDASAYRSTDGVLYTNFANDDLPVEERVFQLPADTSASSPLNLYLPTFILSLALVEKRLIL